MTKMALGTLLSTAPMIVGCSSLTDDGSGGTPGIGGSAGSNGVALTCEETASSCMNGQIDPIVRDEGCMVPDPPVLPDACDGTESLERPLSCAPTGNTLTYRLTYAEIVDDCNLGYDLDDCNGNSCSLGEAAPGEGMGGVDNAIAALAQLAIDVGTNLSVVNQVFYDNFCNGETNVLFVVDVNSQENCMIVETFISGEPEGTVLLNLSDAGCISGKLANIPFPFRDTILSLDNAVVRMTVSESGLANGIVGGTIDRTTATSLAARWIGVIDSTFVSRLLDINKDLDGDPLVACNALSVALRVGGVAEPEAATP